MRATTAVAAAAALSACGVSMVAHQPGQQVARPDSFARAKRALIVNGLTIEDADEKVGIISTTWEIHKAFTGDARRDRWVVTIDEHFVTVASQCQVGEYASGVACDLQSEERNAMAQRLAADM